MGSPPIPDRSRRPDEGPPPPPQDHTACSKILEVPFSPPKRKTGGSLKGKERAIESNSYPGTITYRHLIGNNNGGPANPLRVVAHIDIDAAYAAMEMARLKIDPSFPLAVQQWNGLIAVNYPARTFGITRHESPAEAVKKCPGLILVHCASYRNGESEPGYWEDAKPGTHKISLDHYRRESLKIIKVFNEHCPIVEKASIDESFLDLTLPVRTELLSRYPSLASPGQGHSLDSPLPSLSELGVEIDWKRVGNLIPIKSVPGYGQPPPKPNEECVPSSASLESLPVPLPPAIQGGKESTTPTPEVDEDDSDVNEYCQTTNLEPLVDQERHDLTWSDVALYLGAEIVMKCRKAVHDELGYTCSAGIAPNKMLAKLGSGWRKPNDQTVLRFAAVPGFLHPMRFQKIRNLGGKLGMAIKGLFNAETVGDLIHISTEDLQSRLGDENGMWLWEILRGLDFTEVEAKTQVKSMLSSKNFRPAVSTFGEVQYWMHILATELHLRLVEARQLTTGLWPKTITFNHRSPSYAIHSHQVAFPFTNRLDIAYISKHADKLLRLAAGERLTDIRPETKVGPYNNLQLSFSGLEKLEEGQKGIENFFAAGLAPVSRKAISPEAFIRPRNIQAGRKRQKVELPENSSSDRFQEVIELDLTSDPPEGLDMVVTPNLRPSATCSRCQKSISIPQNLLALLGEHPTPSAMNELLSKETRSHADYHFAKDMVEKDRKQSGQAAKKSKINRPTARSKIEDKEIQKSKASRKTAAKDQQNLQGFFKKS